MKAEIRFSDGKVVELSQETTDRLRKKLIKNNEQLIVDRFRAVREDELLIIIALMNHRSDKWDENYLASSNAEATYFFTNTEVRKIIKGLTKMVGDL